MDYTNASSQVPLPNKEAPESKNSFQSIDDSFDDSFDVSTGHGGGAALLICWLTVCLSIIGSIIFWLMNSSAQKSVTDKQTSKDNVVSQLSSPSLFGVEAKADNFKAAVNRLTSISQQRYPMGVFMTQFSAEIDSNVTLKNLSFTSTNDLNMGGATTSYRAVADQMEVLKNWKVNNKNILKNVTLGSVSESMDTTTNKPVVTFAITATVDKSQSLTTSTNSNTQGGSNATVQ